VSSRTRRKTARAIGEVGSRSSGADETDGEEFVISADAHRSVEAVSGPGGGSATFGVRCGAPLTSATDGDQDVEQGAFSLKRRSLTCQMLRPSGYQ